MLNDALALNTKDLADLQKSENVGPWKNQNQIQNSMNNDIKQLQPEIRQQDMMHEIPEIIKTEDQT